MLRGILVPVSLFQSEYHSDLSEIRESRIDWTLIFIVLMVVVIGLINLYSATVDPETAKSDYFVRQSIYVMLGTFVIAALHFIEHRFFRNYAYIIYIVCLLALISVKFIGVVRNGAKLWLSLGIINFQPSELMKIAVIIAVARYFHDRQELRSLSFKSLVKPCLLIFIPAGITIVQPDMGTGAHMAMAGVLMLLFVGIKWKVILTVMVAFLISAPIAWKWGLHEYQKNRIRTFLNPTSDPRGIGYNSIQSMIAVGSGELIGKGFRKGTQTQLHYTPEGHTDFIFTVLAEEWGLLGCLLFLGLYLALVSRCLAISTEARDVFSLLFCIGIACLFASQVMVNVSMVIGLFPIVGIPLPLASYGGSSILSLAIGLGIVLSISYRRNMF